MSHPKTLWEIWQAVDRQPHARPRKPLYEYLDSVGDGTGWFDAVSDHSGVSQSLWIVPPAGTIYRVFRILPYLRDTGSLDADGYGNGGALANGIALDFQIRGQAGSVTGRHPIKTNSEWAQICHDVRALTFGVGDETLTARLSFWKAGVDLELDGNQSDYLRVVLNDDFTFLNEHTFHVQGYQFETPT